jgi:hypothetical protein
VPMGGVPAGVPRGEAYPREQVAAVGRGREIAGGGRHDQVGEGERDCHSERDTQRSVGDLYEQWLDKLTGVIYV